METEIMNHVSEDNRRSDRADAEMPPTVGADETSGPQADPRGDGFVDFDAPDGDVDLGTDGDSIAAVATADGVPLLAEDDVDESASDVPTAKQNARSKKADASAAFYRPERVNAFETPRLKY